MHTSMIIFGGVCEVEDFELEISEKLEKLEFLEFLKKLVEVK